jgi:uncharacterized Zn-binding protein involved in type VI secretion
MPEKTQCPLSRQEFREHAPQSVAITIAGNPVGSAGVKEFSTGSLGWHATGKLTITINGKPVAVNVNLILTLIGSKELPKS